MHGISIPVQCTCIVDVINDSCKLKKVYFYFNNTPKYSLSYKCIHFSF